MTEEKSYGENLVRLSFNNNGNILIEEIKKKTAELIDLCQQFSFLDPRLAALATTNYENAAMWAVKLATTEQKVKSITPCPVDIKEFDA